MKKLVLSLFVVAMLVFGSVANASIIAYGDIHLGDDGAFATTLTTQQLKDLTNPQLNTMLDFTFDLSFISFDASTPSGLSAVFSWSGEIWVDGVKAANFNAPAPASLVFSSLAPWEFAPAGPPLPYYYTSGSATASFSSTDFDLASIFDGISNDADIIFKVAIDNPQKITITSDGNVTATILNPTLDGTVTIHGDYPNATTPEPATLALFGLGALALPVVRRFRNK